MSKKIYLISILRQFTVALGIYFLIVSGMTLLRPLYLGLFNENIDVRLVATGQKNPDSLANNVRIRRINVNGKEYDLSKLDLNKKATDWKYASENDFIYVYNTHAASELTIQFENVHSLSFEVIEEVGSGILDIYLNDSLWLSIDLYKNTDWEAETFGYETSIFVFPERCLPLQIISLVILNILCIGWMKNKYFQQTVSRYLIIAAEAGCLSIIVSFIIGLIQYGDVYTFAGNVNAQSQSFLKAMVLILLFILFLMCIFGRLWLGFSIVSVVMVIGSLVSKIKLLNRNVPLLPWDFSMAKEAASVISNYEISISSVDVLSMIVIIALIVLLIVTDRSKYSNLVIRIGLAVFLFMSIISFIESSFIHCNIEAANSNYRVYQVNDYYNQRGFISAFMEYCVYLDASEEPDNYSRDEIERIVDEIQNKSYYIGNQTPTIIAVMSESFWDIERVDTLTFNEEVLPNFKLLESESRYGELFTHVYNGGTVVSEFEFLTGFSGEFFPQDYMVYGSFVDPGFASAVSILEAQGYHTTAIHPYIASNYNRQKAYENFGFDNRLFDTDFSEGPSVRNYISDEDLFNKVIEQYEENAKDHNPQFIFTVTVQNHGGYWEDTIYKEGLVEYTTETYGEVAQQCISDYVAGLHESDRALGEMIDYFRNVDDNVIVVFFGDHVSDAGPKDDRFIEQTSWTENTMTYDYETHKVPFLVWSNFENKSENIGLMEAGELLPYVFETYNIRVDKFWNYLQDFREVYSASDNEIVVNGPNEYRRLDEMTDEQKTYYDIYHLLQYDYIWGNRYGAELWEMNEVIDGFYETQKGINNS